jgi:hypothetical protein
MNEVVEAKTIKLGCYGIEVVLIGDGAGSISSLMHGSPLDSSSEEERLSSDFNLMVDAMESMILSHAIAGIDIASPAYMEGIETAYATCGNETI